MRRGDSGCVVPMHKGDHGLPSRPSCLNLHTMTDLLQKAFEKANVLSEHDQEAIGQLVLDEIESEAGWDERFAASPDGLSGLAAQALDEHRAGKAPVLDLEADDLAKD